METFTLGTAIGLNMNASFYADSVNAAARNKARLVVFLLVMYSCRFMKSTRLESFQRDCGIYGKRVRFTSKASIGNIGVFSLIEIGKEQYIVATKANFKLVSECNWKNTFFYLPNRYYFLSRFGEWGRGLLCGYSVKSQFEICGVYSKKWYTRKVVGLR